jgi:hypothetical protein
LKIDNYASFEEMYKSFSDMYDVDSEQIEWKQDGLQAKKNEVFFKALDEDPMEAVKRVSKTKKGEVY